jgi:hypothetical protein
MNDINFAGSKNSKCLNFSRTKRPFILLLVMLDAFFTVAVTWTVTFRARTIRSRHYEENRKQAI